MDVREGFAVALRAARRAKGLTQEDFGDVSGRTYLSALERGMKSPTLDKLQDLADVLGIHPLTVLTLTYMQVEACSEKLLVARVEKELEAITV